SHERAPPERGWYVQKPTSEPKFHAQYGTVIEALHRPETVTSGQHDVAQAVTAGDTPCESGGSVGRLAGSKPAPELRRPCHKDGQLSAAVLLSGSPPSRQLLVLLIPGEQVAEPIVGDVIGDLPSQRVRPVGAEVLLCPLEAADPRTH